MSFLKNKGLSDLSSRIFFTFFILCIYRFAVFVPIPGIDLTVVNSFLTNKFNSKLLGIFNSFSGGALQRMSIMVLGLTPYISSSIVIQLLTSSVPKFKELKKDGPSGQEKIKQYTRYLTLALAVFQSYAWAISLEYMSDSSDALVMHPGYFFRVSTVFSLVGATLLVMWLSEQITARGIGSGSSIIIFINIISSSLLAVVYFVSIIISGKITLLYALGYILMVMLLLYIVVCMENVIRPVQIQYPNNHMRMMNGMKKMEMPIKLNVSGVLPPMFAEMFLSFIIIGISNINLSFLSLSESYKSILTSTYVNLLLKAMMIAFFAFIYATMTFNPEEVSDNLKRSAGYIPGIRPGEKTKEFFIKLINTLTVFGAMYLVLISISPDLLLGRANELYISGTSLLIIVGVTLEFFSHVNAYISTNKVKIGKFRR